MTWPVSAERIAKGLWWDRAWSLVDGCTPVSEGCESGGVHDFCRANEDE